MLTIAQLHAADGLEKKIRTELADTGGTWWGQGAHDLGFQLGSPVETDSFVDLYTGFRDPRAAHLPADERPTLGTRPGRYLTIEDHKQRLQQAHPDLTDRQLQARARQNTRSPYCASTSPLHPANPLRSCTPHSNAPPTMRPTAAPWMKPSSGTPARPQYARPSCAATPPCSTPCRTWPEPSGQTGPATRAWRPTDGWSRSFPEAGTEPGTPSCTCVT